MKDEKSIGEKRVEYDKFLQEAIEHFLEEGGKTGIAGVEQAVAASTLMICIRLDQIREALESLEEAVREK